MSAITTHVLDTSIGKPAAGVPVELSRRDGERWAALGAGRTDSDGRLRTLLPPGVPAEPGIYQLRFDTGAYYKQLGVNGFYPYVEIAFEIRESGTHHHVPLLLNPFGYSTYRGS